jgi:hypothetical protein
LVANGLLLPTDRPPARTNPTIGVDFAGNRAWLGVEQENAQCIPCAKRLLGNK